MNAPANIDLTRFNAHQAEALLRACEIETELRIKLANGPLEGSIRAAIRCYLAGVTNYAVGVIDDLAGHDGFEDSHRELQAELEAVDVHRLWVATARPEEFVEQDYFPTSRVTAGMGGA